MNKLKKIDHGIYDINKFKYEKHICKKQNNKKEYEVYKNVSKPINIENLSFIRIYYNNLNKIIVTTPEMVCPFGFEGSNNNFSIKLQFTNLNSDKHMESFYNFIKEMESSIKDYIGLTEKNSKLFKSQIFHDSKKKYDPLLIVKIPFLNNRFNVNVYNDNYNLNISNIHKFSKVKCDIYIDSIWVFNDTYICKWKLDSIYIL